MKSRNAPMQLNRMSMIVATVIISESELAVSIEKGWAVPGELKDVLYDLDLGRCRHAVARGVLAERLDPLEDADGVVGLLSPDHANTLAVDRLDVQVVGEHGKRAAQRVAGARELLGELAFGRKERLVGVVAHLDPTKKFLVDSLVPGLGHGDLAFRLLVDARGRS